MRYALMYDPESKLGNQFPTFVLNTFRTLAAAQAVRHNCANPDQIRIVEVEG